MIKLGDIILIEEYLDDNGEMVSAHPLIVINTEGGKISGLDFDFIGCFMSSFKNSNHKSRVLKHDSNLLVTVEDGVDRDSYIKADVIHYFDSSKINYIFVGELTQDLYDLLLKVIRMLSEENRLEINTNNL